MTALFESPLKSAKHAREFLEIHFENEHQDIKFLKRFKLSNNFVMRFFFIDWNIRRISVSPYEI